MGLTCARYVPPMCPLCTHYVFKTFRVDIECPPNAAFLCALCVHKAPRMSYVFKPYRIHIGGSLMRPVCAHYVPPMCPLCI